MLIHMRDNLESLAIYILAAEMASYKPKKQTKTNKKLTPAGDEPFT